MTAFFSGVLFGALLIATAFVAYLTRARRPRREPEPWSEETYQVPVVTTRVLIRERSIEL